MEITSRFVEHADLGQLHVVRFEPENHFPNELAVVFNSFRGRITTIDGFAVPYVYAQTTGLITDYVERPGTGLSSPIEDKRLRKNYLKHGFLEVSDPVAEALESDPVHARALRLHAAGFSLGWHAAPMYLESVGNRAASSTSIDGAGTCSVNRFIGSGRYFTYLAGEATVKLLGKFPDKDALFKDQKEAFEKFLETSGLPKPELSFMQNLTELHEVTQPTQGEALRSLSNVMRRAAGDERDFEHRGLVTPMRIITDHRTIKETNEMLNRFDGAFPGQETVTYGLLQRDGMSWWHDMATDPLQIRKLLNTPISALRRRLRYFR